MWARDDSPVCPKCGNTECWQDSVDVGVGVIYGPLGCPQCGWSEDSEYDLSDGKSAVKDDGSAFDQWGGVWPAASSVAKAYRMAEAVENRGAAPERGVETAQQSAASRNNDMTDQPVK